MDEWLEHNKELSRKTTAVLEDWSKRYDAGKITRREYFILVTGLYDATSGLVERDVSKLLAAIHEELRKDQSHT